MPSTDVKKTPWTTNAIKHWRLYDPVTTHTIFHGFCGPNNQDVFMVRSLRSRGAEHKGFDIQVCGLGKVLTMEYLAFMVWLCIVHRSGIPELLWWQRERCRRHSRQNLRLRLWLSSFISRARTTFCDGAAYAAEWNVGELRELSGKRCSLES